MRMSLSECCTIVMGQSPDSVSYNSEGQGIPFYQGNADFGETHPVTRIWCSRPLKIANKGDILLSVRAPIGALNIADNKSCIGRGLAAIRAKKEKCVIEYVYYYLQSRVNELNQKGTGSTFKAITRGVLDELDVPIVTMSEQRRIADVFILIDKMRRNIKKQLLDLDLIVKSRFIEMFGTIKKNNKDFRIVTIEDVCELIKDGTHQTPQYTEDKEKGFKFLSSKDVMSQKIDWDNIKFIPKELHEKLYKTIKPRKNDVLMSKNGVNYGVAAVNDTDEIFDIYVSLALLRPKSVINPYYLKNVINSMDTKMQFDRSIKGIGVPNLHLGEIKKTKIMLPPIELQNHFVEFTRQVDKSKLAVQQSLNELETLKKSLMQQYFG